MVYIVSLGLFSLLSSILLNSNNNNNVDAALYLPGVGSREFLDGDQVDMKVNKITSIKTQLPYQYYSLPVCKPNLIDDAAENLGEVLSGDRIENSLYNFRMKSKTSCQVLCKLDYTVEDAKKFQDKIKDDYRVHWILDNMPISMRVIDESNPEELHYERGFPLGAMTVSSVPAAAQTVEDKKDDKKKDKKDKKKEAQSTPQATTTREDFFLYNHLRFTIKYHEDPSSYEGARIIAFEVIPFSIKHKFSSWPTDPNQSPQLDTCNDKKVVDSTMVAQTINGAETVVWTYDVNWEKTDIEWTSRWDVFLKGSPDDQIHWFSIINSLMIVIFLTGMVGMIFMRTLYKDIARYNEEQTAEEAQEETGWKLVHGDVFRPPNYSPMLLAVLTGTGVQIMMMIVALMPFALLGFLSPANRGGLMTTILLLFVFMGSFAGYVSARLYKMFSGKKWKRNTVLTALLYPGTLFVVGFIVNLFVWRAGSSGAVPFTTMLALIVLWFGISVPLAFVGSYFGFKQEEIKNPVRFNQIPRQIPEQSWYMNPIFSIFVGGILPFGAVFIELYFILSSIWLHQIYYVFGFFLIVLLILLVTCAEISMVLIYFQLCSEDYEWWWRAFLTSGSSGVYLFAYSILYFSTKLHLTKFTPIIVYFGYMFAVSFSFFILTGTIGFLSCLWFLRIIFGSIKVD